MADCNKTDVFMEEVDRMGMSCNGEYDGGCDQCAVSPICSITIFSNKEWRDKVISDVQKWSDEHPLPKPKTYADVFLETFPHQCIEDGNPSWRTRICRKDLFGGVCQRGYCEDCWNGPYKEDENG